VQAFGVAALIGGYCAWYTLYQKVWGDGSGYLYNLTGSTRFSSGSTTLKPQQPNTPSGGAGKPPVNSRGGLTGGFK
jgi:hypothetical protein